MAWKIVFCYRVSYNKKMLREGCARRNEEFHRKAVKRRRVKWVERFKINEDGKLR